MKIEELDFTALPHSVIDEGYDTEDLESLPDTFSMVWGWGENVEEDELDFYCGPEGEDGPEYVNDCISTNDLLTELFDGFSHEVDVGAAENYHTISYDVGKCSSVKRELKALMEKHNITKISVCG